MTYSEGTSVSVETGNMPPMLPPARSE